MKKLPLNKTLIVILIATAFPAQSVITHNVCFFHDQFYTNVAPSADCPLHPDDTRHGLTSVIIGSGVQGVGGSSTQANGGDDWGVNFTVPKVDHVDNSSCYHVFPVDDDMR